MHADAFRRSLADDAPPPGLATALLALWWAKKGDWNKAHSVVMGEEDDRACAWVHAHLHRIEGDLANAHYWYRQAGRSAESGPLPAEWDTIVAALTAKRGRSAR